MYLRAREARVFGKNLAEYAEYAYFDFRLDVGETLNLIHPRRNRAIVVRMYLHGALHFLYACRFCVCVCVYIYVRVSVLLHRAIKKHKRKRRNVENTISDSLGQ